MSYADVLKKARDEIKLSRDIDIEDHYIRPAYTGGYLIEVCGEECVNKADQLAKHMSEICNCSGVRITRPSEKMRDVKIYGFDVSVTNDELMEFVAGTDGCTLAELRVNSYRFTKNNMGIAWIKCPIRTAKKLYNIGSFKIGWSKIFIEKPRSRPLQCYRCHELGHSKNICRNPIDRSGYCYNCGGSDHKIKDCKNATYCYVCRHYGRNDNHKVGSGFCMIPRHKDRIYYADRRDGFLDDK